MSNTPPAPIISGIAYRVINIAGRPLHDLDELLVPEAEFTIDHDGGYVVRGSSRKDADADAVKFYEKDSDGIGKDLRVWRLVQEGPDSFTATHIVGG
jgi:hypothetical protein